MKQCQNEIGIRGKVCQLKVRKREKTIEMAQKKDGTMLRRKLANKN